MIHWRTFPVFTAQPVTAPADSNSSTSAILGIDFVPSFSQDCGSVMALGDKLGRIKLVTQDWQVIDLIAHKETLVGLMYVKKRGVLISMGMEDNKVAMRLKFWSVDGVSEGKQPNMIYSFSVFNEKFPYVPVTSFSVLDDLTQCTIGLSNGALILIDGNLVQDVQREYLLLKKKGACILHTCFHPVTDEGIISLYVVTLNEVLTYYTRGSSRRMPPVSLDEFPVNTEVSGCTTSSDGKLLIATPMAVYFYEREEKSVCFGFEGMKKKIFWLKDYLVLVEEVKTNPQYNLLTIYDIKNKFIAFSQKFTVISEIAHAWDELFVCTEDHHVRRLTEKDLSTKMEMFFRKNLYPIAISVAKSQSCDTHVVMDIYQMYGDHLYEKKDYDNAMIQYLHTINYIEPSYVIRKFLDAQQIYNLTRYLEAMHQHGRANTDHTTLLLNCFTKLKDINKLGNFIHDETLKFDVKTAIKVCREACYYEQALYLAHKHKEHAEYISIQLEDEGNIHKTMSYILSLDFDEAYYFTHEYGQELFDSLPDEATDLFTSLCTKYEPIRDENNENDTKNTGSNKAKADDFIHFFVGRPDCLERFLEKVSLEPNCPPVVMNTLLELFLRPEEDGKEIGQGNNNNNEEKDDNNPSKIVKKIHRNHHKIMNLLKSQQNRYDLDHALVLTKMYKFEKGTLYLYGKLKMYNEIVQYHIEKDTPSEYSKVIRACKKYGESDPQLWNQALAYFASKNTPCESEIVEILENIDRHNLLPPLMVIQLLAANPHKPLSVVRDYMIRTLQSEQSTIVADAREITRLQEETTLMKEEINRLKTKATIFQGIRCHNCTDPLSLPAIHFLCMHSFHQRCIDNDRECPECAPEFKKVRDIKMSLKKSSTHHDTFFKQLEESNDGFSTVAEYFGRGIFDVQDDDEIEMELNDGKILSHDVTDSLLNMPGVGNPFDEEVDTNPFGRSSNPFD